MNSTALPSDTRRFSARLRTATGSEHGAAERSEAMGALLAGRLPLAGYASMLAQLLPVYEALEDLGDLHREDPVVGGFVDAALDRSDAIRADLSRLPDPTCGGSPTPATSRYCGRLRAAGGDAVGFVAHHYTRYLGDLSGGQHIGRVVERCYGIDPDSGTAFFHFPAIEDAAAYKDRYRRRLDEAPWSASDRERFIEEVRLSYELNGGLLESLSSC